MQWAMIEDKIVRVAKTEALAHLRPKLNGYRRYAERIYIGVTANPERRWQQHRPNGWSKDVYKRQQRCRCCYVARVADASAAAAATSATLAGALAAAAATSATVADAPAGGE